MNYDDDDQIDDNDDNDDNHDDNNDGNTVFFLQIHFFVRIQYLKLHYSDQRWFQASVPLFHFMEKVCLLVLKLVLNLSLYPIQLILMSSILIKKYYISVEIRFTP